MPSMAMAIFVSTARAQNAAIAVLYGNEYRHDFGVASAEFMLPDCFGFPASVPSIMAAAPFPNNSSGRRLKRHP